jgi:tetratricopeptide (TPR) repeat protein
MLDPLEASYPFALAEMRLATGHFPAARRHYVAALRRDPLNGKYLQALGALQARDGERAQGERLILSGLRDRSVLAERQEFYARWLAATARREEAMQVVREGLTRSPGQTRSFLQTMILEGIPLREMRQALPNRSRCFIDYGDYQRESGDPRGAEESYQLALGLAMGEMDADPSIFRRLFRYFSGDGNDEAALAALQAGLRVLPTHSEFRCLSAETYKRLGLKFRAAEEYRKTLLTDPDNQKARQGLQELAGE